MTKPIHCHRCHDTGIVELAGTDPDGYSRGSAPCQWCDEGTRLYRSLTADKHHPLSNYHVTDLAAPAQPDYHEMTKAEALAEWDACHHDYRNDGPPQNRPWNKDAIQLKTCHRCGKQEVDVIPSTQPATIEPITDKE